MIASISMQMPAALLSRQPAAHDGTHTLRAPSCRHGKVTTMQIGLVGLGRMGGDFSNFEGHVSDAGEGRWTSIAAIDVGAPAPALMTALYERFMARGEADFADRVLSAMRYGFGGHEEQKG
jgi:6-phosphogluconate dehydrogenase (decarboxylating)